MRYEIALLKQVVRLGSVAWNGDYESAKERARELLTEREEASRVIVVDRVQERLLFSLVRARDSAMEGARILNDR